MVHPPQTFILFLFIVTTVIETDKEEPQFQLLPELLSGMFAGMLTCVAFYPLECMEARLQVFAQQKGGPGENKAQKLGYALVETGWRGHKE